MKKIPDELLNQSIQCIRLATHTQVSHDTVEQVARALEQIRDDDTGDKAEQLADAFEEEVDEGSDEEAEE